MMKQITLLLIIAVLTLQCNEGKSQTEKPQSEEEKLEQLINDYYNVMSARDWKMYKQFFSEKATLTTVWQSENDADPKINTSTITEFLAQTAEGPDSQPIFEELPLGADIMVKNNLAQAWVSYQAKFGTEDNLMEWKGIDLISFLKFEGEWKIVSIVFESE